MNNKFINLQKLVKDKNKKDLKDTIENIASCKDFTELDHWYIKSLGTEAKRKKYANDSEGYKKYLIERAKLKANKSLSEKINRILTIGKAGDLKSMTISIEWKKSGTWGSNPTATCEVVTSEGYKSFSSGSISGSGYCKESTAFADASNQSNALLKALYKKMNKNKDKKPSEIFGYGSGYGLPRLEGGVGVSCYYRIFEALGFKMKHISSGKTFEVYIITK